MSVTASQLVTSGSLVLVGLLMTGAVWWIAMGAFGVPARPRQLVPQFFVAQLGKYIPGSVWAFAAQAAMGARQRTLLRRLMIVCPATERPADTGFELSGVPGVSARHQILVSCLECGQDHGWQVDDAFLG